MKTKQYTELSGGSKAVWTFWMPRAGRSSKAAILTAWSWLRPVLPVEGRHPLAAMVGSICAKMQLFLLQTLKMSQFQSWIFTEQTNMVFFRHTHSHVSQIFSHANSRHQGDCCFVFAWMLFYTLSTSIVTKLLQDHYTTVQYLDVVLKILIEVYNEQRNSIMMRQWETFSGYSGCW